MEIKHDYRAGDRVRVRCPYAGGFLGEEVNVLYVKRDNQGSVLSLDILLGEQGERSYVNSVYPDDVEPIQSHP